MIASEPNPNEEIVRDLRELSRAYGGMARHDTLRRLSVHLQLDENNHRSPGIEIVLEKAIATLPPAYGRAAHALFSPSGRSLRFRQEEAADALGMSWESFRKRHAADFYYEFAQQLRRMLVEPEVAPVSDVYRAAARQMANEMMSSSPKAVLLIDGFLMVKTEDHLVGVTLSDEELADFNGRRAEVLGDADAALAFLMKTHHGEPGLGSKLRGLRRRPGIRNQ